MEMVNQNNKMINKNNEMEIEIQKRQNSEWDNIDHFDQSVNELRDIAVMFWNDTPSIDDVKIMELEKIVRKLRMNFEIMMR